MGRRSLVLALVALVLVLLPARARAQEAVSDATAETAADAFDGDATVEPGTTDQHADEQGNEGLDESGDGLEDQEMTWHGAGAGPNGEPVEVGRRRTKRARLYLYDAVKTDREWDGHPLWCLCERVGEARFVDEFRDERERCVAWGIFIGSGLALVGEATVATFFSPEMAAAMAALPEVSRAYTGYIVLLGGLIGAEIAIRICPPSGPPRSYYVCPSCPGCPGGYCPCPCPCPPPCPDGPPCPVCPPGCPQIPGPGGDICRAREDDEP